MPDASGFSETKLSQPGIRPRSVRIETAWVDPVTTWTVSDVRAALCQHEEGRFALSAALADQMMRDPVIAGDVQNRCRALASRSALPFKVEPGGGDGRRREVARQRCEDLWWEACPESTIYSIQKDTILLGLAVGRVWWTRTASEWRPRLYHLPAHGLAWQPWDRRWTYSTRDGEELEVTPGDGTWFLHLPNGERSWMGGAVRQLGEPWLQRVFARRDWARYSERNGMPVLAVYEPASALDDIEGTEGADGARARAFYRQLRGSLTRDGVLRLPQPGDKNIPGWDGKWLELTAKNYEVFSRQLESLATECHLAVLGRDPNSGAKGGDGELAGERRHSEYLATDAETLSTTIRDCVLKPDVAYNIAPNDVDLAGWGRWDTRPPADLGSRATTINTAADALAKLAALGVDCQPVAGEFGLTGTIKAPAPPASAPQVTP